jgi:hypothetical protein
VAIGCGAGPQGHALRRNPRSLRFLRSKKCAQLFTDTGGFLFPAGEPPPFHFMPRSIDSPQEEIRQDSENIRNI